MNDQWHVIGHSSILKYHLNTTALTHSFRCRIRLAAAWSESGPAPVAGQVPARAPAPAPDLAVVDSAYEFLD
jgi:hypothetical protein